jgi:hypothetical protein
MRRLMAFGAAAVVGAVLFMGAPAYAATTGYPPPTTTPVAPPATLTITCPVGSTCTLTFTGFLPGSPFQIIVAGQIAASGTVGPTGTITVTISVTDPHISVNGGPLIAVPYGANAVTAQGTGANGQPLSLVDTVIIPAPAASTTGTSGTTGTSSSSSGGSLAFTGAQIGMMVGGGLLLLVAGTGLVLVTRQRRSRTI